jgi:hypothetical protein
MKASGVNIPVSHGEPMVLSSKHDRSTRPSLLDAVDQENVCR